MVDDCVLLCKNEKTTKEILNIIDEKTSFASEEEKGIIPFKFLGIVNGYNGVDIQQTLHYIEMLCESYIN